MFTKKLIIWVGLCCLLAGCSTARFGATYFPGENNTKLGVRYLYGRGVLQSNEKAFAYFSQAADNEDDAFAQNEVAYLYAAGKGTPQNYRKAIFYYQKAANHGLASAEFSLGQLYWYGLGTPADKTLAREWFKKSAAKGFGPAKLALTRYQ